MAAEATSLARAATAVEAVTTSAVEPLAYRGRPEGAAAVRTADIYERHGASVLGLCRVLLRNQHEAEDAAQQTFLAAYRSIRNGVEPRHPAAWLATIARNECRAAIERRMREPIHQGEPESGLPDPVAQAAASSDLEELWRAIEELPPQQRQALLLREFSGLTYAELAVALGVTEPAVDSLLVRARRALRGRLRPLSGSVAAVGVPLGVIRDALARLLLGMPDAPAASGLARLGAAPAVAKLAAGAVAALVAGGTVAAVESPDIGGRIVTPPADAAVAPKAVPPPIAHRSAAGRRAPAALRVTARPARRVEPARRKRVVSIVGHPASTPAVSVPQPAEPPAVSTPERGAAPVAPLPSAAPVPEEPVVQATPSAAGDDRDSSGPGASAADSSGPGEGGPGGDEGDGAAAVEGSGPGGEAESGSASSGRGGGGEGQESSGEGPSGATESGDAGGGDGKSGSDGGGDDHGGDHGGGGGEGHGHGHG